MIVLVVDVGGIAIDETEGDAPVAADADGPRSFARSGKRMQNQTWKIHVLRAGGDLQTPQNQSKTLFMLRLDTGLRAFQEEALKPLVSERPDHAAVVTRNVARRKTPNA